MNATRRTSSPAPSVHTVRVWDPLIRVVHWTLVVAFLVAYLTEDDLLTTHAWAGYVVGAAIVLRVLWGFIGPPYARFTDFLYSPSDVLRYAAELISLRGGKRYLGHSPTGGLMIMVLLAALAVTVWSGLEVFALQEGAGPLAGNIEVHRVSALATVHASEQGADREDDESEDNRERDEEHERGERDEYWEELHEFFANLTLALVILHVAGVLLASYVHRENLVQAMFTGRKRAQDE